MPFVYWPSGTKAKYIGLENENVLDGIEGVIVSALVNTSVSVLGSMEVVDGAIVDGGEFGSEVLPETVEEACSAVISVKVAVLPLEALTVVDAFTGSVFRTCTTKSVSATVTPWNITL